MERLFGQKLMNEQSRDAVYALAFLFALGFVALLSVETSAHLPK